MKGSLKKMRGRVQRAVGETLAKAVGKFVAKRYGRAEGPLPAGHHLSIAISSLHARKTGISRGAQQQAQALRRCGLDVRLLDASPGIRNPLLHAALPIRGDVLIIHSGGPQLAQIINYHAPAPNVRRIGYIAWELPASPHHWRAYDSGADEIWTPSRFSAEALKAATKRPVTVVRHVSAPPRVVTKGVFRERLGLKDGEFLVLTFADLRSSLARKNPLGAIAAFRNAFGERRDVRLLVKLTAADREPSLVEQLKIAAGNANVEFLCEHLNDAGLWSLFADADAFLSLHRAEGFGLPILEAMSVGCTVIGTAWSGNCDFMDTSNAAALPYKLVDVTDPQGIYRSGVWAEPDMDAAVEWLRRFEADRSLCRTIGDAARASTTLERQLAAFQENLPEYVKGERYTTGERLRLA
jgi:glycosyltransferase involved in cell wall biosynthesis